MLADTCACFYCDVDAHQIGVFRNFVDVPHGRAPITDSFERVVKIPLRVEQDRGKELTFFFSGVENVEIQ